MSLEEYRSRYPNVTLKYGVLEAFCQKATLDTTTLSGHRDHREILWPPRVLGHSNASCIHAALEQASGLSVSEVQDLSERSAFVFYNDGPDPWLWKVVAGVQHRRQRSRCRVPKFPQTWPRLRSENQCIKFGAWWLERRCRKSDPTQSLCGFLGGGSGA